VNVDVYVDAAVTMAGEECGVHGVAGQVDVFGRDPVLQLTDILEREVSKQERGCSVLVADERAVLVIVNTDISAMIIDSHNHSNSGAVIALCKAGHVTSLAAWFDSMMKKDWGVGLGIASLAKIDYVHTCASQP